MSRVRLLAGSAFLAATLAAAGATAWSMEAGAVAAVTVGRVIDAYTIILLNGLALGIVCH
jgi:hypothetical protein